jgi:hypothetical protein
MTENILDKVHLATLDIAGHIVSAYAAKSLKKTTRFISRIIEDDYVFMVKEATQYA